MTKRMDSEETPVKLFGSVSRARILSFLYAFEGQSFYQREIMYETGLVLRAVERELKNLSSLGIVKVLSRSKKLPIEFIMRSIVTPPSSNLLKKSAD
jgi:predicted transcriptional regulator